MFYPTTCVRFGTGVADICLADFLGSLFTRAVCLPEGSQYCQVQLKGRICLASEYLHSSTDYSVSPRRCHSSVPASLPATVTESLPFLPSGPPRGCPLGPDLP